MEVARSLQALIKVVEMGLLVLGDNSSFSFMVLAIVHFVVCETDNAVTSSDLEYLSKSKSNRQKSYSSRSKKVTHIFSTLK